MASRNTFDLVGRLLISDSDVLHTKSSWMDVMLIEHSHFLLSKNRNPYFTSASLYRNLSANLFGINQRPWLELLRARTIFLLFLFFHRDLFPEGECFYLWSEGLLLCHSGIPQIKIKHSKVFQDLHIQNNVVLLSVALSGVQLCGVNSCSGNVCFNACVEASNVSR